MATSVLSASSLTGDRVVNPAGEDLGKLEEIMLNLDDGSAAYAVVSFGGFMGLGDKLFAIPWEAILVDQHNKHIVLDVPREKLESAEGFDKDNWPEADEAWTQSLYSHYGYEYRRGLHDERARSEERQREPGIAGGAPGGQVAVDPNTGEIRRP